MWNQKTDVYLHPQLRGRLHFICLRPIRLSVRTPDFHSGKRGSIPLWATIIKDLKVKIEMANHQSSIKRIRQTEKRKLHNRYYAKTARNAVRKLRATTEKAVAVDMLPKISAMLDKLAKRNIIHKNKASNLKSKLAVYINKLA